MSYFKPIILPKNNIYKFWVKENFGGVLGGPNAQKCGKMPIFRVLTPKNHPPQKISPKIDTFSFLIVCLAQNNTFSSLMIERVKNGIENMFLFV